MQTIIQHEGRGRIGIVSTAPTATALRFRDLPGLYVLLTKARLSSLVLATTLVAYLSARRGALDFPELAATMLGAGFCAFSANTFNQAWEKERDALMERTKHRPLPSERLSRRHAVLLGLVLLAAGQAILLAGTNPLTAMLALATVLIYLFIYTPLKPRSSLNTLVGAVCGALPPMLGWTAAAGRLEGGAWLLGLLLFIWQIPHFLALAWLHREDYARAGFRMLPATDPAGRLTGALAVLYSLALLPLGVAMSMTGMAGPAFAVGYLLLNAVLVALSLRLWRRLDRRSARQLFLATVIVLPLALGLLLADPGARTPDESRGGRLPPLHASGEPAATR